MENLKGYLAVFLACTLVMVGSMVPAAPSDVQGTSFSDPNKEVPMDSSWQQQELRYESWAEDADLAVTLDQHLYPALSQLISKFADERKIKVAVQEGTCGISAGLLSNKHVDIGGFCCPPGEADRLPGLQYHTLGISALGILVNSENPLENLDAATVRKIFKGEIISWEQISPRKGGGSFKGTIRTVGRLHCKQRPGHWRHILGNEDLFGINLSEVGTINDMIRTIGENRAAIGYEVLWNIQRYGMEGKIKPLRINNGNPQAPGDVASLKYPFYRAYEITTWSKDSGVENSKAMELVAYILSHINRVDPKFEIIPADRLRTAGWIFSGNEVVGEPDHSPQ